MPRVAYGNQHSLLLQKENLHSLSVAPILLHEFNRILHFDLNERTLCVQAGCTLNQINDFLDERGFSLASYPEFFDITAGACVTTPVHGYSRQYQCLASLVTRVRFVRAENREIVTLDRTDPEWQRIFFGRTPGIIVLEVTFACIPRRRQFLSLQVFDDSQLEHRLHASTCDQQIVTWYPASRKISEMQVQETASPGVRYRHIKRPVTIYRYLGFAFFVLQMYLKRARHLCGDSNQLSPGFRRLSRLERAFIAKGSAIDVELSMPLASLRQFMDAVTCRPHPEQQLFIGFRWGGLREAPEQKLWRPEADLWVEMVGDERVIRHVIRQLDHHRIALHSGKYLPT